MFPWLYSGGDNELANTAIHVTGDFSDFFAIEIEFESLVTLVIQDRPFRAAQQVPAVAFDPDRRAFRRALRLCQIEFWPYYVSFLTWLCMWQGGLIRHQVPTARGNESETGDGEYRPIEWLRQIARANRAGAA